jgi:hypothetical protein
MGINNIGAVSNPISFFHGRSPVDISRVSTEKASPRGIHGEEKKWNINHSRLDFVGLQKINDRLNSEAIGQRTLKIVDDYIEQMKAQLVKIMKQFPPFPPGSEDRIQALRAYAYFRKMIDQLTIPPREDLLPSPTLGEKDPAGSVTSKKAGLNIQANLSGQIFEIQISS